MDQTSQAKNAAANSRKRTNNSHSNQNNDKVGDSSSDKRSDNSNAVQTQLADKERKMNVNVIMGFQNIVALAISLTRDFLVGFLCFGSMYCSNFALKYVNYPFVVLSKSAKIMPVIIMGSIRKVYTLHYSQYILAILISTGLIMFNSNKLKNLETDNLVGITLVLGSLFFDGLTSSQTDKQHKQSGRDFAYSIMFSNNFVQLIANILFYIPAFFYQNDTTVSRVMNDSDNFRDVVMIGISGALGQIFIYLTISIFNSYLVTVITTSRKLFSVFLSSLTFHHKFSTIQWAGAFLVMICTMAELLFGRKHKQTQHEKELHQQQTTKNNTENKKD
eukprot:403362113